MLDCNAMELITLKLAHNLTSTSLHHSGSAPFMKNSAFPMQREMKRWRRSTVYANVFTFWGGESACG